MKKYFLDQEVIDQAEPQTSEQLVKTPTTFAKYYKSQKSVLYKPINQGRRQIVEAEGGTRLASKRWYFYDATVYMSEGILGHTPEKCFDS